ncbi:methyltransferase domain-containing protein [Paraliomyxa miuraensis]|uniref:methyltransferase domain-containing protein n=1 Tax=Paraliomyxa miuraensis TaxID=376150 RepID=UPI00224D6C8B|nr:methyltransferase domain-containing protein [Paraliomyxa miuraensis]MCX4242497.1 methyltransferase domain-containing protein [Paraliomyxa miuraensis]
MALFPDKGGYPTLAAALFDTLAPTIAGPFHAWAVGRARALVGADERVLDVGCGGGHLALQILDAQPTAELVGIDPSPTMITRARRRAGARRLSFVEAPAEALPFADGRFDVVVSVGAFKHWSDQGRGLRECTRMLAPGGRLLVLEADRDSPPQDVEAFVSAWRLPRPLRSFMGRTLARMIRTQGLTVGETEALVGTVPGLEATVHSIPGLPAWAIEGRRPDAIP